MKQRDRKSKIGRMIAFILVFALMFSGFTLNAADYSLPQTELEISEEAPVVEDDTEASEENPQEESVIDDEENELDNEEDEVDSVKFMNIVPMSTPIQVASEQQIRDDIAAAVGEGPTTIELTANIQLTASFPWTITTLLIPQDADIILTGNFSLIGPADFATITIQNGGKLTLNGPTITHNFGQAGRGVVVNAGGTFVMENGNISRNGTRSGNNFTADGGGVLNDGTFIMNGGNISDNVRTLFSGNNPTNSAAGVHNRNGTFTMNGGTISNNAINFTAQGNASGNPTFAGGVWNNSIFTMNNGTITGNLANYSDVASQAAAANSGGVKNRGGTFTMNGGSISDNLAWSNGGGGVTNWSTFTLNAGTISGNRGGSGHSLNQVLAAGGGGGGVHNISGEFRMTGGTISGNSSNFPNGNGWGGGVRNAGRFIMEGGLISGNNATFSGGGVHNQGTFIMHNGEISDHTGTQMGAGVSSGNPSSLPSFEMRGGSILRNISDNTGGGIHISQGNARIYGGLISRNEARRVGTGVGRGGGINASGNQNTTITINGGTISNNRAFDGAGIAVSASQYTLIINDGEISENTASQDGGGVSVGNSAAFRMYGGEILDNRARDGAGVHISSTANIRDEAIISGNIASRSGGGVFGGSVVMHGGEISGNTAGGNGGGVHGTVTMHDGEISGNTATGSGGGIQGATAATLITIHGGVISGNTAGGNGGGINGNVRMHDGEISGNTANNGGGIFIANYLNLNIAAPAIFSNNRAASASPNRNPANDAVYASNIHATTWTVPFSQGFNNFDINHSFGTPMFMLTYNLNGGTGTVPSPALFEEGDAVTAAAAPSRSAHNFDGWRQNLTTVRAAGSSFTMPAEHVTLTAIWAPSVGGPDPVDQDPVDPDPVDPDPVDPDPVYPDPVDPDPVDPDPIDPVNPTDPGTGNGTPPVYNGNELIPGENGTWIELDEFGVPLGEWRWDDDEEVWIFEAFPPLAAFNMPKTGETPLTHVLFLLGAVIAGTGVWVLKRKRIN